MKRRILITFETERLILIDERRRPGRTAWCAPCAREVWLVTVDDAAMVARTSARVIYQWAEAGLVHFRETPEGGLLICLNSLP
ncbi:MAG TPA: hypothetical protein VJT09_02405 [Pyrinomonadaceae bacterium]|nr:hypothetical protein [Pyrinomonadaceae bacterium]